VQGSLEPTRRVGVRWPFNGDRLPDADVVAARIDDDELAHAVGHVAEGPDARDASAGDPPECCAEAFSERVVQAVDVGGEHVTAAVRRGGVELLEDEELQLDPAARDDRVRVRPFLLIGD